MDYRELKILLRSAEGGRLEARAVEPPFGGTAPAHEFDRPFDDATLDVLADLALQRVREAEGKAGTAHKDDSRRLTLTHVGTVLFEALFAGEMGELYRRCQDELRQDERRGLRLRLIFDPGDREASAYLARLPWEVLFDPRELWFVARRRGIPVVRDLTWREPLAPVKASLPLRILLVDAAPRGMRALDLKTERERLHEALAALEQAGQVEIYRAQDVRGIRGRLLDDGIQILHLMGHGGYLDEEGLGAVYVEDPSGGHDQLNGVNLGEILTDVPDLRLAVINSCQGARYSGSLGRPAHHGVAAGVLQRTGLPAVVAMQYVVSDLMAIAFTAAFYRALARGDGVDTAMSEARLATSHESGEWGTPVLFMSAKGGRLFDLRKGSQRGGAPSSQAAARKLKPRLLKILSMNVRPEEDLGRHLPPDADDELDLRQFFNGRFIKHDSLWLSEILPRLRAFLADNSRGPRPVDLALAAHGTVAYAAGWILHIKSGRDVAFYQPTKDVGMRRWSHDDGSAPATGHRLWIPKDDPPDPHGGPDVALALGVSRSIAEQVVAYVKGKNLPVGRILDFELTEREEDRQKSVAGGAHAQVLARALEARLVEKHPHERGGCLHVFSSAPIGLLFYLGQLARPFGHTQLYEYPLEAKDTWARYHSSLELPPPGEGHEPPPGW
jgi:hypothetical protein